MAVNGKTTLTARTVASARAPVGKRLVIRDVGKGSVSGLELRVTPDQTKTWSIRYYRDADGKRRRFTLGSYPEMGLEEARRECANVLRDVRHGHDPAHARELRRGADTFKALAEEYLTKHASKRRSHAEIKRILEKDWYPEIGNMRAGEVPRSKIINVVDAIAERGSPVAANRALAMVRQVYRWALSKAKLEMVPVIGIRMPHEEKARVRALTPEEIKKLWNSLPETTMSDDIRDVVRLALILGQRVGEITGMRSEEIDLESRIWVLPPERVKNGNAHSVPLPDMALSIIAARMAGGGNYLFPGRINRNAPMLARAPNKALQRNLPNVGLSAFTIHDIRRSVNSQLARLGVSSEIRSRLLNHVSGRRMSVTESVYNVHQYDEEKRRALEVWTAELDRILNQTGIDDNVVRIGRA